MTATLTRRLTRSRRERVFGGVCGGLAGYFGQDPVLIRVGFVALTLLTGPGGILLYLFAWIIVPLDDLDGKSLGLVDTEAARETPRHTLGLLLVVAGLLALGAAFLPPFWRFGGWKIIGPVLIMSIGLILLFWRRSSSMDAPNSNASSPEPARAPESSSTREPASPGTPRRLVRRHRGRKIAGVAVGMGEYFNVDPTLIRIVWLALLFVGGTGLLLYLIMWIVMPLED